MNSPCRAYLLLPAPDRDAAPTVVCELPLHHAGEHLAHELMVCVGERPRGGKARRNTSVSLRWRG